MRPTSLALLAAGALVAATACAVAPYETREGPVDPATAQTPPPSFSPVLAKESDAASPVETREAPAAQPAPMHHGHGMPGMSMPEAGPDGGIP